MRYFDDGQCDDDANANADDDEVDEVMNLLWNNFFKKKETKKIFCLSGRNEKSIRIFFPLC